MNNAVAYNGKELKKERAKVFMDTMKHQNKTRILNCSNFFAWTVYDSGEPLNKAARDYDLRLKINREFQERYNFDLYQDYWTRNPLLISDALGYSRYILTDENCGVQLEDFNYINSVEDYDLLLQDYVKFLWEVLVPNKYKNLNSKNCAENMKAGYKEYVKYMQYCEDVRYLMEDELGLLSCNAIGSAYLFHGFELLFNGIRGIKELSIDLRRNSEKLEKVVNALGVFGIFDSAKDGVQKHKNMIDENTISGPDSTFLMLGHTILNNKQFEKFFLPGLQNVYEFAKREDQYIYIFAEGDNSRFYEYIEDAPKGHFIYHTEMDDIFEVNKRLGDKVVIAGGMPNWLLGKGTVKENVYYAEKLLNEIGGNGNFIFSQQKMGSFPIDATRENLLAVNKVVQNFKL